MKNTSISLLYSISIIKLQNNFAQRRKSSRGRYIIISRECARHYTVYQQYSISRQTYMKHACLLIDYYAPSLRAVEHVLCGVVNGLH